MDGRLILMVMLLISGPTKFAFAMKCFICYDFVTCEKPYIENCDPDTANWMREQIEHLHTDVKILNTTDYSCFAGHYSVNNVKKRGLSGCIFKGTLDCNRQSQSQVSCSICDRDLCNSAAATTLSFVSMFIALVFFLRFKVEYLKVEY